MGERFAGAPARVGISKDLGLELPRPFRQHVSSGRGNISRDFDREQRSQSSLVRLNLDWAAKAESG